MEKYTFPKEERLCNKRLITGLFHHGSSFFVYPYRITAMAVETQGPKVQVLLSVPKRRFPLAVHRNLLKRRMREAYRLQKAELLYPFIEKQTHGLVFAIQYVGREILDYQFMHTRMADALMKLQNETLCLHLSI